MVTAPQHVRDTVRARIKNLLAQFEEKKKQWEEQRLAGSRDSKYSAPEHRPSSGGGGNSSGQRN